MGKLDALKASIIFDLDGTFIDSAKTFIGLPILLYLKLELLLSAMGKLSALLVKVPHYLLRK